MTRIVRSAKNFLYTDPDKGEPSTGIVGIIRYQVEPVIEYTLYILGILTILTGMIVSIVIGVRDKVKKRRTTDETIADVRITMSEFISLGLTFILGAEVVKTFRVPNIFQLIKITLLVLLRQLITFFLDQDVKHLKKEYPSLKR